jgi:xanthine dehydrogenase YagR molybdenum-binding subunit
MTLAAKRRATGDAGGELGVVGTAAAIANAVWHATGARYRTLPMTPDRVLRGHSAAAIANPGVSL